MADAVARREARRRRILENSESRLQRISGRISNDDVTDKHDKKCQKSDLPSSIVDSNSNGTVSSEALVNSSYVDSININDELHHEHSQSNVLTKRTNLPDTNARNDNETIHDSSLNKHTKEFYNIPDNKQNQKQTMPSQIIIEEKTDKQSIITEIFTNRLVYIFLAVIMNVILTLKMENSSATSIIIPFFFIFASRLWIMKHLNINQRYGTTHSLIIAALMLCKVQPHIVYTLKKIFYIVSQVITDLAIFIFSFVSMYYIISRYWIGFDMSMANKIEIMIDRHSTT